MRPKVKICGITNLEDASLAVELGADILGFIFAESPRKVTVEVVGKIISQLRSRWFPLSIETVGVFVNEDPRVVESVLRETGLTVAQIHGDETSLKTNSYNFNWYKALRVSSLVELDSFFGESVTQFSCGRLLFDAAVKGLYGGSGVVVDRGVALEAKRLTKETGREFFIAGGITPENVASIITEIEPDGIDLGSGVEAKPGKKDPEKMRKLFEEIKCV